MPRGNNPMRCAHCHRHTGAGEGITSLGERLCWKCWCKHCKTSPVADSRQNQAPAGGAAVCAGGPHEPCRGNGRPYFSREVTRC